MSTQDEKYLLTVSESFTFVVKCEYLREKPYTGLAMDERVPVDSNQLMDDVWGDDESSTYKHIERIHHKQGYVDGLVKAQESSLQNGFDDGLPKGAVIGIQVGKILATVMNYDMSLLEQCKQELNISKVLDKQYFDDDLEMTRSHLLLDKWEKICQHLTSL